MFYWGSLWCLTLALLICPPPPSCLRQQQNPTTCWCLCECVAECDCVSSGVATVSRRNSRERRWACLTSHHFPNPHLPNLSPFTLTPRSPRFYSLQRSVILCFSTPGLQNFSFSLYCPISQQCCETKVVIHKCSNIEVLWKYPHPDKRDVCISRYERDKTKGSLIEMHDIIGMVSVSANFSYKIQYRTLAIP